MLCAERRDLILLLTSGALDAAEEQELRAHLATGCPACAGHLAEAQAVWSQIPLGLAPITPTPAAKEMLMIKVDATGPQTDRSGNGPIPIRNALVSPAVAPKKWAPAFAFSAIAAALAVVITYLAMNSLLTQKDTTIALLNQQLSTRQQALNGLNQDLINARSVINMLKNPTTQIARFDPGQPADPMPAARMLWNPTDNHGIFLASDMKPPAPGRCYELWLIVGNNPADKLAAGEVTIDAHGNTILPVVWKDPVKPVIFAITDEPARPNITDPQGPITMLVKM